MLKAQVEIVIVLGIIIVAAVGILFATQTIPPVQLPTDVGQELNVVSDSVKNLIVAGSQDIIKDMGLHGGYFGDPPVQSVNFVGEEVAYWQIGGQVMIPDIESAFVSALTEFIEKNKNDAVGQDVTFESASITNFRFLNNSIEFDVNMPTTIHFDGQNYPLEQPYRISIPTKLKEVKEFSENFVNAQLSERYLEYFTMASIIQSELESGIQKTPVLIQLSECGDFVFKTWEDIRPDLEFQIESTLTHTYMPGKVPLNTAATSSFPKYTLPAFNGNEYQGLDINFDLPDRFELTRETYQLNPQPIVVFADHIELTSKCQSDAVTVNYFLKYPAIVRVRDTLTGNDFNFAIQLFIKDNGPADFGSEGYVPEYQAEICRNLDCPVDLLVTGSDSEPLRASVNFMGCHIGDTGTDGVLRGMAPCGIGVFEIFKRGYGPVFDIKGSQELVGDVIQVEKMPVFNIHFHEVNVNKQPSGSYIINPTGITEINDLHTDQAVSISFFSPNNTLLCDNGVCQWYFNERIGQINNLPADIYSVSASLLGGFVQSGMVLSEFEIAEDLDGEELHVYLPYYLPFKQITNQTQQIQEGEKLTRLLEECGIGPFSTQAVELNASCIKTEGELA